MLERLNLPIELKRTIHNWYAGGDSAAPNPMFNVLQQMLRTGEGLYTAPQGTVPMLPMNEEGDYFLPLFTDESIPSPTGNGTNRGSKKALADLFDFALTDGHCIGLAVDPWGEKLLLSRRTIETVKAYRGKSFLSVFRLSVLALQAGAIVNAANNSLLGGGGVDGAIHAAAGPALTDECRGLHGCATGEAKSTGAYNLKGADRIIHTVGPIYDGSPENAKLLAACYRNSLDTALADGCASVAFPCISTGVYGYPCDKAAQVALATIVQWLGEHEDTVMNIYIACYRDAEYDAYLRYGVNTPR